MEADRYSRQRLFAPIGPEGQKRIRSARVTLVGCGALGTNIANLLARSGVGRIRIADRDFVELTNLQRQVLFDEEDVRDGLPKAIAAARKIARINGDVAVDPVVADVTPANVESLVADADVVLDGTDNFETRFVLNDACVKLGKPWVYGGCVGSYGMVLPVVPGESACLRCWLPDLPGAGSSPTCDTAGVLNTAVGVVASLQANEAAKLLAGRRDALAPGLTVVDVWANAWSLLKVERQADCRSCEKREFEFLETRSVGTTTVLCGRNAVQITPPSGRVDLAAVPGTVLRRSEYFVQFRVEDLEFTLFPDGRAIVQGTADAVRARAAYAKYVGA